MLLKLLKFAERGHLFQRKLTAKEYVQEYVLQQTFQTNMRSNLDSLKHSLFQI